MNKIFFISVVFLSGCLNSKKEEVTIKESPFKITGAEIKDYKLIQQIEDDYQAVIYGKEPIHAKLDMAEGVRFDGGTSTYNGINYRVRVWKKNTKLGGISGVLYGPEIFLDGINEPHISKITFYSMDNFQLLVR